VHEHKSRHLIPCLFSVPPWLTKEAVSLAELVFRMECKLANTGLLHLRAPIALALVTDTQNAIVRISEENVEKFWAVPL
jgi:hypothetical protein